MITLRQWKDSDLDPLASMNADPEVMRFFTKPLTREEAAAYMDRMRAAIEERGWGFWAVEVDGEFAGLTGISPLTLAHFAPFVEIGWRFRQKFWGRGIAFAAAAAALDFGFEELKLTEIVSFTAVINTRSRRLMERLGFTRKDEDDFLHPKVPEDSPLHPHVLYRKSAHAPKIAVSGATIAR